MYELKTNTAVRIAVGPLVDPTDGKTAEVALTVTGMVVEIFQIKTDGTAVVRAAFSPTASGGNNDMVHVTNDTVGMYDLELTATQLNWLGNGRIAFYDVDGFLVHWIDILVVSANYFDWKYGTGNVNTDVIAISGDTTAADNAELMFDGTGYAGGTTKLDVNAATLTDGAITAAKFGAGAINAAAIANGAIDAATFAADVDAEIATMIWNAAVASYGGAGTYGQALEDSLADTNELQTNQGAWATATGFSTHSANDVWSVATRTVTDKTGFSLANGSIANATFNADVGSTAFATNVLALGVFKALDSAIGDAVSLTANGLLEKVRRLSWILSNKVEVTDANGNTVVYKDDNTTAAYTVNAALTDDSTTTTRLRMV